MGPMMGTGPMMMGRHHMMMGSGPMMMGPFMGRGPNMHMMPLMSLPQPPSCEDHSGDFVPTQCHGTECFCVDDRGMEVPGTRSQESDLLDCGQLPPFSHRKLPLCMNLPSAYSSQPHSWPPHANDDAA